MERFDKNDVINGRFFDVWVNGEKKAEAKTANADSTASTTKIPIAGKLGTESIVTGIDGSGSITFYKVTDDSFIKDVNNAFKEGKQFIFDLIGQVTNKSTGGTQRTIIEDAAITKFSPLAVDIEQILETSYDFEYNPDKVDIE